MLSRGEAGLGLFLIFLLTNIEGFTRTDGVNSVRQRNKAHKPVFYNDAPITDLLRELFKEALHAAAIDVSMHLTALREKHDEDTTYYKAYYINKLGMGCHIDYSVTLYEGMLIRRYECVNEESEGNTPQINKRRGYISLPRHFFTNEAPEPEDDESIKKLVSIFRRNHL